MKYQSVKQIKQMLAMIFACVHYILELKGPIIIILNIVLQALVILENITRSNKNIILKNVISQSLF